MKAALNIFFALVFFSINAFSQDIDDIKFMKKINHLRNDLGLNDLQWNATLDSAAQAWANEMLDAFRAYDNDEIERKYSEDMLFIHINFDKRVKSLRRSNKGVFSGKFVSEIAVLTTENSFLNNISNEAFNGWKSSKPHYNEMVSQDTRSFGFSYFEDRNTGRALYICVFSDL